MTVIIYMSIIGNNNENLKRLHMQIVNFSTNILIL